MKWVAKDHHTRTVVVACHLSDIINHLHDVLIDVPTDPLDEGTPRFSVKRVSDDHPDVH